mgnify:CR=1 FL=1
MSLKSKVSSLTSAQTTGARAVPRPQRAANPTRPAHKTLDFRPKTSDLPFVLVNMAMTADGKIATANRTIASFGSKRDHDHLLELRATADAVMSGARTVDSEKISMGPGGAKYQKHRLKHGLAEFNLRVIVSGSGSIDPRAEVFKHRFSPIIILTTQRASAKQLSSLRSVADEVKICGAKVINFSATLLWLRKKYGVKRLLCEGGGDLNDAMFRAGLVDELHLTLCPKIFGGRTAPTIAEGAGFETLAAAARLELKSTRRAGAEMFLVYGRIG